MRVTRGNPREFEKALGLPKDYFSNHQIVRVDIPNVEKFNLRVPSGNEAGANEFWIPGGKLPQGNIEAVLDVKMITTNDYIIDSNILPVFRSIDQQLQPFAQEMARQAVKENEKAKP